MVDDWPDETSELPAGPLGARLATIEAAIDGTADADVACGTCTACCTSSQFVHVGPDEVDARAHIPATLLFAAPGLPPGHHLMGYDEHGHCPMLVDDRCSIYDHRPRTCRTYDCRVFPAAGIDVGDDKPGIARRARRWRFSHPTESDRIAHDAVRAAARFLVERGGELGEPIPSDPTQVAVLAVELHGLFRAQDGTAPAAVDVAIAGLRRR